MNTLSLKEVKLKIEQKKNLNKDTLWLIGERKWTIDFHKQILESVDKGKKPQETGIFLTEQINWDDFETEYRICTHLILFNDSDQFTAVAIDKSCRRYLYHHSNFTSGKIMEFRNVIPRENHESRGAFRYGFAQDLGAIHDLNKEKPIQVVVDRDTRQWRLKHD